MDTAAGRLRVRDAVVGSRQRRRDENSIEGKDHSAFQG